MLTISNRNSQGFFKVYNAAGSVICDHTRGVSCFEYIKKTNINGIKDGKIEFYYPSDWLCNSGRNPHFFKHWLDLAGSLFHEVKFVGKVKTSDLGQSFDNMNGQNSDNFLKGVDLNNFIFNDEWYKFEMQIVNNNNETQIRQYCAYCMIRYLFSDHYDQIIKTYNRIRNININYSMKIPEFELLQMAHLYFPGETGYYQTYVLVFYHNRDCIINKLVKEEKFREDVKTKIIVNDMFNSGRGSGLRISDFQKLLETANFNDIYGKIK